MRLQLVAYDVGGSRRGVVPPGLSLTRYLALGETPTLEAEYTALQGRMEHLEGAVEVAFQYSNRGEDWVEPINGRYIIDGDNFDRLDHGQAVHRLSFLGLVNQLRYADVGTKSLTKEGQRKFSNATPGTIMATLIGEAKAAGLLRGLSIDFSGSETSTGASWAKTCSRVLDPTNDLLTLLESLGEAGLVDYWTEGRTLRLANPGSTLARDLSDGDNPVYLRDQAITASPENVSYGDVITQVRVIGENGCRWTFTNENALDDFGPRIATVTASGVTDTDTARSYADEQLRAGQAPVQSLTREYDVLDSTPFVPDRDFRLGDWIKVDNAAGPGRRMRVIATSLREESGQTKAFVTLGAKRRPLLLRVASHLVREAKPKRVGTNPGSKDPGNWGQGKGGDGGLGSGDPYAGTGDGLGGIPTGGGAMIAVYKDANGNWPQRPSLTPPPDLVVEWIGPWPAPTIGEAEAMAGDLYLQSPNFDTGGSDVTETPAEEPPADPAPTDPPPTDTGGTATPAPG